MARPIYETSFTKAVTAVSGEIEPADLVVGATYLLTSSVDAWFAVGSAPVAAVQTDGSHLILAGQERVVAVTEGARRIAIIRHTGQSDGTCSLSKLNP